MDKVVADTACAALEAERIPCWIAPRDVLGGEEYGKSIMDALSACQIVLLIFSRHANDSAQVRREIERAASKEKIIVPFRIEDILPSDAMEYALGNRQWLDGITPPMERRLADLCDVVSRLIQRHGTAGEAAQQEVAAIIPKMKSGLRRLHLKAVPFWPALAALVIVATTTFGLGRRSAVLVGPVPCYQANDWPNGRWVEWGHLSSDWKPRSADEKFPQFAMGITISSGINYVGFSDHVTANANENLIQGKLDGPLRPDSAVRMNGGDAKGYTAQMNGQVTHDGCLINGDFVDSSGNQGDIHFLFSRDRYFVEP